MILLIDNYDSFTYNLYQALAVLGETVVVRRNDALTLSDARNLEPDGIVISPGPGEPSSAGISLQMVREMGPDLPLLGVCLGHQCIAQAFEGSIVAAPTLVHGKTSEVVHDGSGVFRDLPSPFPAVRYHSLAVDEFSLSSDFRVTARTTDGVVMGLRHEPTGAEGVQFHPESVLTHDGPHLLQNFIARCGATVSDRRLRV